MDQLSKSFDGSPSLHLHLKVLHDDLSKWLSKSKDGVRREQQIAAATGTPVIKETPMVKEPCLAQPRSTTEVSDNSLQIEMLKTELANVERELKEKRMAQQLRAREPAQLSPPRPTMSLAELASQLNSSHVPTREKKDSRPSAIGGASSSFQSVSHSSNTPISQSQEDEQGQKGKKKGWKKLLSIF